VDPHSPTHRCARDVPLSCQPPGQSLPGGSGRASHTVPAHAALPRACAAPVAVLPGIIVAYAAIHHLCRLFPLAGVRRLPESCRLAVSRIGCAAARTRQPGRLVGLINRWSTVGEQEG
jgi:hypothetical protein